MDNLAIIIGIDMENPPPIGIVKKSRLVTDEEEFGPDLIQWLSGEGASSILDVLDETYRVIHHYLKELYTSPEMNWENEKTRRGISSMMSLVGESAQKMEAYLAYRLERPLQPKIIDREAFKSLHQFYADHFSKKFRVEGEEPSEEGAPLEVAESGINDLEVVKRDQSYELFYIRNEEGNPYFSGELLKSIKLSCDFEGGEGEFEEDPLLKIRAMEDRDLLISAGQMLEECKPFIEDFFKINRKLEGNELSEALGMAVFGLLMAANPRHLLQNTIGKSCMQYFDDFHRFLRRSMRTTEYQKLIAYPPDKSDKNAAILLSLTHSLSRCFFCRKGGVKQESIGLIHRTMRRGEEIKQKKHQKLSKGETIWNQFLLDDEKLRTLLSQFPNGPLFKVLDLIREEQDEDTIIPFDPIGQHNLPGLLYEIQRGEKAIQVLRLPCPTRQSLIHRVEIVDEFRAFLRSLSSDRQPKKHLIVNLQDRTSWKEQARSRALESIQKNAEFTHQVFVVTLPKETDFYHQNNEYLSLSKAEDFFGAFKKQLKNLEECGYLLPLSSADLIRFADEAFPLIHEAYFQGKNTLTRRHREDFIEIFYQFLILKCIEFLDPDSISFTCKDAIDTGAVQQGTFYGFLKILTTGLSSREDQDFLRWLIYTPALFIRERAVDPERVLRAFSALERLDEGKEASNKFSALYRAETLKKLSVG
jgi:hypothetical protein